jgi:hypothetical protein
MNTPDPIESHHLVIDALAAVERAKADQAQTKRDLVSGSPVSPTDLAAAAAAVEHAELLVERARREAKSDLQVAASAEALAQSIRDVAARMDGEALAGAKTVRHDLVSSMNAAWTGAAAHTDEVRSLAERARSLAQPGRHGIGVSGVGVGAPDPRFVEAVSVPGQHLVETRPVSMIASAVLEVLEARLGATERPDHADLLRALTAEAAPWQRAVAAAPPALHNPGGLSPQELTEHRLAAMARRRAREGEIERQQQAEAEERARREGPIAP